LSNIAIPIVPASIIRYKTFGDWVRGCYADEAPGMVGQRWRGAADSPTELLLRFDAPQTIDRVVVREDQTEGQAIRGWSVLAQLSSGSDWTWLVNGTSIGNKWIHLLDANVTVTALKAVVTASASTTPVLKSVSGHLCSRASTNSQCSIRENWESVGVQLGSTTPGASLGQCCDACKKTPQCALFVLHANRDCELMSAQGPGGKTVQGAISGSPPE